MPPYCMECGEWVEDGASQCEYCGAFQQESECEVREIRCPVCRGTGEIHAGGRRKSSRYASMICQECAGTGRLMVEM